MSCFKGCFLAIIALAVSAHSAAATTLFFDFGYDDSLSSGSNYNDVIVDGVGGGRPQPIELLNTIDSTGASTGIGLSASGFYHGGNPNGTSAPSGDAAIFVSSATRDNAFTHVGQWGPEPTNPKAELVLTGLDNSTAYDFTFFASRMNVSDNRETMYTVVGSSTAVAYLDAANNVSNVATVNGIYPDAGSITINFEAGPNNNNQTGAVLTRFAYLGAMRVEYTAIPEPGSLVILSAGALLVLVRPRRAEKLS